MTRPMPQPPYSEEQQRIARGFFAWLVLAVAALTAGIMRVFQDRDLPALGCLAVALVAQRIAIGFVNDFADSANSAE